MRTRGERLIAAGLMLVTILAVHACAPRPAAAPDSGLTPIGTLRDIMENIVEPAADVIFDAVSTDISVTGTIEHKPTTDAEWEVVQHNALTLVEATNLIKMPRPIASPGDEQKKSQNEAPELTPAEIKVKKDQDPALWIRYADGLRDASLKALNAANMKDATVLFQVGNGIDRACENCHLEYWYPSERKVVLDNQKGRSTPGPDTHSTR